MTDNELAALAKFARWVISQGAWEGAELEGSDIQDMAEKLGLIVSEPNGYDPEKHGPDDYAERGDPFFVYAPFLAKR